MSVTEVKLHSAGASASVSGGKDAASDKLTYSCKYRVKVSDPLDTPKTVLNYFRGNADLPWKGRPFRFGNDFDVDALCNEVSCDYTEMSAGQYIVTCKFESAEGSDDNDDGKTPDGKTTQDPILWHDQISISTTTISVPVEGAIFRGFYGANVNHPTLQPGLEGPVVNSAMTVLNPPLEEELHIKVLRMSRYIRSWDDAFADKYRGMVNSDNVTINKPAYKFKMHLPAYQAKIAAITGEFGIVNGIPCYNNAIEVHIHPNYFGWRRLVPDQGVLAKVEPGDPDGRGGTYSAGDPIFAVDGAAPTRQLTDNDGFPLHHPVNFNGLGQPLKPGQPAVYLIWSTKKEIPFAGIPW